VTSAVVVDGLSKKFRLIHEQNHSLKATIIRGHRVVAEDFWALRDVSFEVPQGTTFGLVGENGSGKSTLLKCLARILRPEEGSSTVHGKMSALLELGAGFHPELSGRENVYLNGAILGVSQKELRKRFDEIVDFAGVEQFIDEPVKNYSSGMYVRLGFSVAINVDPDVLLVDEVLAVGDEAFQRKCNEKFADLKANGKTIVLVSHAMASVQNICDEVAWFEHGRLCEIGPPRDVIQAYTGTVEVDRHDDGKVVRWGSGEGLIERVDLLDRHDRPVGRVPTGEQAGIRFHYQTTEPIERPVICVSIDTVQGIQVTGPTTRDADFTPDKIDGEGYIDMRWDRLRLLPGTYDLSVSLRDQTLMHIFDFRPHLLRFDVDRGPIKEGTGVVSLDPVWSEGHLR
jgi:ABC-type polysaccharide/polyol phosphate transport system ATPase subunit